jgi:hypothetical protein
MEISERLPDLSDKELDSLHANAVRLAQSGTLKQRQQAEELMPLLDAALETRRVAHAEAQAAKRAPAKRKAAAKK